jgi:hypothetical protein
MEENGLLQRLLDCALMGLESYGTTNPGSPSAEYRLAFRELGLSIGLKAVGRLQDWIKQNPGSLRQTHSLLSRIKALMRFAPMGERIEKFWMDGINQKAPTWREHRGINEVMLATSLTPDGYLSI